MVAATGTELCLRCGQAALREHHREHKRMGGRGVKAPPHAHDRDPLCRGHHAEHHDGLWDYQVQGDFYVGTKGGDFRSPLRYDDQGEDRRYWTFARIARDWQETERAAVFLYRDACQDAWILKERMGWMERWAEQAGGLLSLNEERPVDWRRVYERVKAWETFELRLGGGPVWEDVYLLGERARLAVARQPDPQEALDKAMVLRLGGATANEIVRELAGVFQPSENPEQHQCPLCGYLHRVKREPMS